MTSEREVTSGYLIERSFERMYVEFHRPADPGQIVYSIPRRGASPEASSKKYRGIARDPLHAWFHELEGTVPEPEEREAATELRLLEDAGRSADDFIDSLADAKRVWDKLRAPTHWELIWAGDCDAGIAPPPDTFLLGYEPTWFWGDHFSAISDCMCFPTWHGTDEEGVLFAEHHHRLNKHALYPTTEEARAFLQYYRSFDWTETGDYVIAEVRLVGGQRT
jgi:hypothetical protein